MRRTFIAILLFLSSTLLFGQSADQHPDWPGKGQLFVGTCYQPVDRSPEQIRRTRNAVDGIILTSGKN